MEVLVERAVEWFRSLAEQAAEPWMPLQVAAVAASIALGFLINRWVEPRVEQRVRTIRNWPRMLRLLAVVLRRTRWLLAAAFLWLAATLLHEAAVPGGAALVRIAATLVTAWALIGIASRAIRNRSLAHILAVIGWMVVVLGTLDLLEPTARTLDAYALSVGNLRISTLTVLKGVALLAILLWIATYLGDFIERSLRRSRDVTPSFQVLFAKLGKLALYAVAVLATLTAIGVDLTALTIFSGAIGLGLGFGLQKVVSNLVSGMIILADKSIKPGDVIQLGETFGWIRSLRARFVSVVTRDGREYLIPNEDLITERVINWTYTDQLVRLDVTFGVSYDSDPHQVRRLATDAAATVARVIATPAPVCHLTGFGESSLDFVLRFWISDAANGLTNVRGAVLLACWDAFKANGVEIPFPRRDVVLRRPPVPAPKED